MMLGEVGCSTGPSSSTPEADDVICQHRLGEALQRELLERLSLDQRLDRAISTLGNEDLAALGLVAQPGGQVGDRSDRGIVEAALETDPPQGGIAHGNADGEIEPVATPLPLRPQLT